MTLLECQTKVIKTKTFHRPIFVFVYVFVVCIYDMHKQKTSDCDFLSIAYDFNYVARYGSIDI